MRAFVYSLIVFLFVNCGLADHAHAYSPATNGSGTILKWSTPNPTYWARWNNASSLTYSNVFSIFTNALSRWKAAGSSTVSYEYWQGSNSATPANYGYDGRNAVFFSSESSQKLGSSTLGVTYVYSSGGTILEADIEFNDDDFTFTTNASDSSRFGPDVFLENVATHEFGHSYGLTHSASLQSSMVYLEYRNQAKLSCDDIHGISSLYPGSSFTSERGNISGVIKSGTTSIFGAHVLAISATRGVVMGSAVTRANGQFTISNLEPGNYYLMVEPFQGGSIIASLCGGDPSSCYYGTANSHTICSGSVPFKRSFVESFTGLPSAFQVTSGSTTNIATYNITCSNMSGDTPNTSIVAADLATPLLQNLTGGAADNASRDIVMGGTGTSHYFKLSNVSGNISAKVLAFSLYSPFDPVVTVVNNLDLPVAGVTSTDNAFSSGSTLYTNYDSSASVTGVGAGNYYIKVTNNGSLATSKYPAGNASTSQVDALKFYLLIVTVNDSTSLLSNPTANGRCEASDSFTPYADRGTPPETAVSPTTTSSGSSTTTKESKKIAGCGTIASSSASVSSKDNHFQGPGPDALFSLWGIVFMLMFGKILYPRKNES